MSELSAPTKLCPMCGAEIKAIARKCRFCGEYFDDEGVGHSPKSGIWRDGNQLVMTRDAELPYVCIKTNRPADMWLPRTVSWYPRWTLVLLPLGLLVFVIVAGLLRKQAGIRVGLCESRRVGRLWTIGLAWGGIVLGLGMLMVGIISERQQPASLAASLIPLGCLLFFASAILGDSLPRIVSAAYINEDFIWLKGVHPDYLARFPEFPGVKD
ncbi:MAG: hypothetical protein ACK5WR_07090 [Planctomycetaceae bacterium]